MSDLQSVKAWEESAGVISAMRIGFFLCLGQAMLLSDAQVIMIIIGHPIDVSGVIYGFLTGAFGGKIGQAFAEKWP